MNTNFIKITDESQTLKHYGVLGMKWGKHKRVPDSPEIIRAKKNVETAKKTLKREKAIYNRKTGYGAVMGSPEVLKPYLSARREYGYATQDLHNAKLLEKINSKPKSKSQLKLEAKYQQRGMSNDEATVEAYKHIRTRNLLWTIGGTVIVAGAGYAAYKVHDSKVDKIIKSGSLIQNISGDDNPGIRDAFYGASNKLDRIKYQGMYGDTIRKEHGKSVIKKEIKVLSDIKQASPRNAQKTLEDLFKNDKQFAKELTQYMHETAAQPFKFTLGHNKRFVKAAIAADDAKIDKNLYEAFNIALVDHSPKMQKLTDRYFNELTKNGYNAIRDVNDHKYSGYKSINPIIAFNAKGKIDVVDIAQLTTEQIAKSKKVAYTSILGTETVKLGSMYAGGMVMTKKMMDLMYRSVNNRQVATYRAQNPGTKMTNTEIIRMIERSR